MLCSTIHTVFQQLVPACTILFFNFWCGYYLRAGTIWGLVNREGYYSFYYFRCGYYLRAGIIQGRVLIAEIRYIQCNSLTLFVDVVIEICDWNWHVHRFQMTASPLLSLTLPNCYLTPIPCISSPSNNGLVLIGGLFVHTCGAMCSIKFNA